MHAVRILVVDDTELFLDPVCRILSRNGYEVLRATDPHLALEMVKNDSLIDLLVSDHEMPGMPGTQLIREVRRLSPQTRCLLMTGGAMKPEDTPDGVKLLKKPFSGQDLISAVNATLRQSGINLGCFAL
jgi:CheY-like chemotaxis protein